MPTTTVLLLSIALLIWMLLSNTVEPFYYDPSSFHVSNPVQRILPYYPRHFSHEVLRARSRIPYRISQTNRSVELPIGLYERCMIIHHMNPEYDYHFYDDDACRAYIQEHYPGRVSQAYEKIIPGAYKADLFRYMVLYREGGVYMDCKSSTIIPLRDLIGEEDEVVVFRDRPMGTLLNSFMACTPGHPLIKEVLDMSVENILSNHYGENPLDITGPQTLGRAFNRLLMRDEKSDITPGRYSGINVVGSFYVLGSGETAFDALVKADGQPVIAKTSPNYYNKEANPHRMDYDKMWNNRSVFRQ